MLKQYLRTFPSKLIHRQSIQCLLKHRAGINIAVIQRRPHGEHPPQLAAARYIDQIYALNIDGFKTEMGERKNIY